MKTEDNFMKTQLLEAALSVALFLILWLILVFVFSFDL
jgi:hypothetical protein